MIQSKYEHWRHSGKAIAIKDTNKSCDGYFTFTLASYLYFKLSQQHLTLPEMDAVRRALNWGFFGPSKQGDRGYISKLFPLARPACQFTYALCWRNFYPNPLALPQKGAEPHSLGHILSSLQPQHPQYDLNHPTGWLLPAKRWDIRNAVPGHVCLIAYSTRGCSNTFDSSFG